MDRRAVLIVDDDANVLGTLAALVRETVDGAAGPVFTATTARQAIDLFEGNADIALLITDVVMPGGIDGYKLADMFKLRRPALNVFYVTGNPEAAGRLLGTGHGCVMAKPLRPGALEAAIDEAFGGVR